MPVSPAYPPALPANTLLHEVSLGPLNTFGFEARAERFYRATSLGGLREALRYEQPTLILGGGSNLLLTRNVPGLTLSSTYRASPCNLSTRRIPKSLHRPESAGTSLSSSR